MATLTVSNRPNGPNLVSVGNAVAPQIKPAQVANPTQHVTPGRVTNPTVSLDPATLARQDYGKINYFISDGSQKDDTGTPYAPGKVIFEAPDYVVDDATFKKSIQPLLERPVEYNPDGTPIHPILSKDVQNAIEAVAHNASAIHDTTTQAQEQYGLKGDAAGAYARNILSALSGDGKIYDPSGNQLYSGSVVSDFNKLNDTQKDATLANLEKIGSDSSDQIKQGRALALLGLYSAKANLNARGGTFLKQIGGGFLKGIADNITNGLDTAESKLGQAFRAGMQSSLQGEVPGINPGASAVRQGIAGESQYTPEGTLKTDLPTPNPHLLKHEAGAAQFGNIVGNLVGVGASIGAAALTGGASGELVGASAARLFGAAANLADDAASASRFIEGALSVANAGGKYVPTLANDAQDLSRLASATESVETGSRVAKTLYKAADLSPKVSRFLTENAAFAGQQSLSTHIERTGNLGADNLGKNFAESVAGDAAFRGVIGGVRKTAATLSEHAIKSLGYDPIAPVRDYFKNMSETLTRITSDKSHVEKQKLPVEESVAPRANFIKSTAEVHSEYDAAKAITDAKYSTDEAAEIMSKVQPVKYQGGQGYNMEAIREAADEVDTRATKTKTRTVVTDTTKLGTRTRQIFGRVFGSNKLARARVSGILSNVLQLDAKDSLHATQLYEAGRADEAEKFLLSKGVHPSAANLKSLNDSVLQLARDVGIDTEELANRLSRSRYGGRAADETKVATKGGGGTSKQTAEFTKKRLYGTAEDVVDNTGKIEDIGLANNAIGNLFEILDVVRNRSLYQLLSADGALGYAPIKNARNDIQLVKQKGLERYVSSANHWRSLGRVEITDKRVLAALGSRENIFGAQTGIWVEPELKKELTAQFKENTNGKLEKTLGGIAKFSKIVQDIHTSGGVPGTPINSLVAVQTIIQLATTPSLIFKLPKLLVSSMTKELYRADILSIRKEVLNGFAESDLGIFTDNAFTNKVSRVEVQAVNDGTASALQVVNPKFTGEHIGELAEKFDEKVAGATFRLLNLYQLHTYEKLYDKFVVKFGEEQGAQLAGEATKHFFGLKTTYDTNASRWVGARGPEFARNLTTILISAPRYKQINIDRVLNTIKAFNPKTLASATERAKYALNYQLAGATLLITGAVEALDKAINGHFSTGNAVGTLDELQFPLGDGNIGRWSFTSQTTSTFRTAGRFVSDIVQDKPTKALDELFSVAGYGVQPLLRLAANQKYGGSEVRDTSNTAGNQIVNALEYLGATYSQHPYFRALAEYTKGQSWNAVTDALEAPINVSNVRIIGQVDFNNSVVPDVKAIVEAHEKLINSAYNADGTPNVALQQKIMTDLYKDVRDRVNESGKRFGYDAKDLTDEMSGKLLSLIVGKEAISLSGGVSPEIGSTLDTQEQRDVTGGQQTVARQGAAAQGLDLYRFGDQLSDAQNKIYGAPKRIAAEFDAATKASNTQPSLYDVKQRYDKVIDGLYSDAKGKHGAAATAVYDKIAKVQEAYMAQFDQRIKPLVAKYGTNVIANNSDVFKALQSYIEVPTDLTPFASSKKQPYLTADVKQYLKDRYGVGPLNQKNLATDPEVISAIKKSNELIANGKSQSAIFTLSKAQQQIHDGKMYADPVTMEKIAKQIKAINKRY